MSVYDQIGGGMAVSAIVDRFYRKLVGDPALAPRLDGIEVHRLAGAQRAMLAAALGGPDYASSSAAFDTVFGLGDAVEGHLAAAMADFGVPSGAIAAVTATVRDHHMSRPAGVSTLVAQPFRVPEVPRQRAA